MTSRSNEHVQSIVFGLSDGILNALILATPAIVGGGGTVTAALSLRVSTVALLTALFTVFVSEYAHVRFDLVRAERLLSITQEGRLAAGKLGIAAFTRALRAALLAGASSFIGSLAPLLLGACVPQGSGVALGAALVSLGILGAIIAYQVSDKPLLWAGAFALCGLAIALVGLELHIVV